MLLLMTRLRGTRRQSRSRGGRSSGSTLTLLRLSGGKRSNDPVGSSDGGGEVGRVVGLGGRDASDRFGRFARRRRRLLRKGVIATATRCSGGRGILGVAGRSGGRGMGEVLAGGLRLSGLLLAGSDDALASLGTVAACTLGSLLALRGAGARAGRTTAVDGNVGLDGNPLGLVACDRTRTKCQLSTPRRRPSNPGTHPSSSHPHPLPQQPPWQAPP